MAGASYLVSMAESVRFWSRALVCAGVLASVPASAFAQDSVAAPSAPASASGDAPSAALAASPALIQRIQRSLTQTSGVRLDEQQLRFYLEIVAKRPSFAEFARGYDFVNGPAKRGNPMSHDEFLKMVTPKEMYSSAGINAMEQLQFAFTNWLGQSLIRKAVEELKDAKTERQAQEIRERIDRELDALTGSIRGK